VKRYTPLVTTSPLRRSSPLERRVGLTRRLTGEEPCRKAARLLQAAREPHRAKRDTGFPRAVKLAVRGRAGHRCEACAVPCPPGFGNIQHRWPRKMGGSRATIISSIMNAVLLCGTPVTGDHGLCETRDPHMNAMGFWLRRWEHPALTPIMLHGESGGVLVWLTPDGGYSQAPPEGVLIMIRNTTGHLFATDRAVAAQGHGSCGGWSSTQDGQIVCACGAPLAGLALGDGARRPPRLERRAAA
jgi:hypothetical protein